MVAVARDYDYVSTLAPYMRGLVEMKRSCGYAYDAGAYRLHLLDRFCVESGYEKGTVSRELVASWMESRSQDGASHRSGLLSAARQLSLHILSLGRDSYVPRGFGRSASPVPYIPTAAEAQAFFEVLDAYGGHGFPLMADGYRIAFRLMYCCGMRIAECASLAAEDVDLAGGAITVRHSKGDKDRIVYMAPELAGMASAYWRGLVASLGWEPIWFFPGPDPSKHVNKMTYDARFARLWAQVPGAQEHPKRPTPHCLRHAFVVRRMNSWMEQGVDLDRMMPYLSAYLGHAGPSETYYYYHQVEEAFSLVRKKDGASARVIPEVVPHA